MPGKEQKASPDSNAKNAAGDNIDMKDLLDSEDQVMTGEPEVVVDDDELLRLCKEKVCTQCQELAKVQDEKLRMAAETENLKKRLHREKEEFCKFATESVLEDLLPVLDNLDLALEHGRKSGQGLDLLSGVEMTRKLFLDILSRHNLEPLGEAGEDFDPAWHEALAQQPDPELEPGKICQVVQKGYRLKGRLLRPAKVLVSTACSP
ncbi:molecular chaperone GrpE [Desulfonatronum thiosulfatophilum]|uniref:Protein GrpE n=1 Tax=Desulfonatronum thiosulfatophilum TaxID=617002 RepID=A0A1G6CBL1_9BACT|nr:nucleotide exchange factor GrpE [Desulfonatronum thiosulfatophilum]SDB30182.1 molecular chaperone GrpE [Desulfonatronum thiosulfatophilum]